MVRGNYDCFVTGGHKSLYFASNTSTGSGGWLPTSGLLGTTGSPHIPTPVVGAGGIIIVVERIMPRPIIRSS